MGAMEKALITGISGFIAGHLAVTLAGDGVEVIGTGRRQPEFAANAARFMPLDIRDFEGCVTLLRQEKPDVVYHLAAQAILAAVAETGPRAMLETNAYGTLNLLEACRQAEVPALVVASSDKQYGALAQPPYDDADTTAFQNGGVYELSKAQQDQLARLYAGLYETPAIRVARIVNVYGPGDTQWSRIIPGTIRRTLLGERPRVTAGPAGAALREYLLVEDCVRALRLLAEDARQRGNLPLRRHDGKLAAVGFNLPTGQRFAAAEAIALVQTTLRDLSGITTLEPDIQPGPAGVSEPGHQFVSPARFQQLALQLGVEWAPQPLTEGLRRTIPWYVEYLTAENSTSR